MSNRRVGRAELARRRGVVLRWRRSGESAAAFGGRHGVSQWALYAWARAAGGGGRRVVEERKRRRNCSTGTAGPAASFIPVSLVDDVSAGGPQRSEGAIEIQLRGGEVVRLLGDVSMEQVRAVVAMVRQAC